jgi:hypothetical protein
MGPLEVRLTRRGPPPDDARCVLSGRVLDQDGGPVGGATIWPRMHMLVSGRGGSRMPDGSDAVSITTAKGEFRLICSVPMKWLEVQVEAKGLATRNFNEIEPAKSPHSLALEPGAFVHGFVLKDEKGLPGVAVGLVQLDRTARGFTGESVIATDEQGHFLFSNVPANRVYVVYGKMESMRDHGATNVRELRVGKPLEVLKDVNLTVAPGFSLSGRVVLADGKPLPDDTPISLSSERAWDSQVVRAGVDGAFSFRAIPPGVYDLSTRVAGYRPSRTNRSLDRWNPSSLVGGIERSVDGLVLLLEPGEPRFDAADRTFTAADRERPLRGAE